VPANKFEKWKFSKLYKLKMVKNSWFEDSISKKEKKSKTRRKPTATGFRQKDLISCNSSPTYGQWYTDLVFFAIKTVRNSSGFLACSTINEPHGMKIGYLQAILPCLWRLKAGCFDGWQRGIGRQCTRCFQSVVKVAQRWIATVLATTATTINICLL
jgi:hypothetical protein